MGARSNPREFSDLVVLNRSGLPSTVMMGLSLIIGCGPTSPALDNGADFRSEVVARGPGCDACALEFTRLGRLGGPSDTVLLSNETMIVARDDGSYIAAPTSRNGEAAIFDSLGASARPYGASGDGPGENGRILNVVPWLGDSTVFAGFSRLTVLSGDLGQGRTIRLERASPSHRTVSLPTYGIVVRNYSYPPDRQFVAFSSDGAVLAEMGADPQPGMRRDVYVAIGEVGPSQRPGAFWSAPQRYRIQMDQWDAGDGSHLRHFEDTASWYSPYDSAGLTNFIFAGNDAVSPPPPFLRGIRESADSILWLLYSTPARDWSPTRDSVPALQRRLRREAYDGMIDLRDPSSGRVLLTTWVNLPFVQMVNDSLLVDRQEDEDGFWAFDVYKVRLRR